MLKFIHVVFLSFLVPHVIAQDSVLNRVIFIGDAGEINFKQETIIPLAAELILKDRTTVMFLGDNIYPSGMGLPGSPEELKTAEILRSQYEPMRAKGAPVYFIPGNHDWDKSGREGLAKIKAQGDFLANQNDSLLRLIPANGCPDPIEIPISDQMVIIAYDSEWWLFPYKKDIPNSGCACNSEADVLVKLKELMDKNQDKMVLVASHHPMQTFGIHRGSYSWKDHLFPLTVINKSFYLPLPVIGSLYPLLRSTAFSTAEDMSHPTYTHLKQSVGKVFAEHPNYIYVAGHDHGLQFIKDGDKYQIVSGSGAKSTAIKNNKKLLYKNATQGFVTVDIMLNQSTRITYYSYDNHGIREDFVYSIPLRK